MLILPKQVALAKGWKNWQPLGCKITERGNLEIKEK